MIEASIQCPRCTWRLRREGVLDDVVEELGSSWVDHLVEQHGMPYRTALEQVAPLVRMVIGRRGSRATAGPLKNVLRLVHSAPRGNRRPRR